MTLVLLCEGSDPAIVTREPEGSARQESALRDLLFAQPAILPIGEIDPSIGPLLAVARELNVPGVGRIDAFFADPNGRLVVVECKLWRNPQARREVVGQILDYARALARFGYDDLQREVSRATGRQGNALFDIVKAAPGALDEARFVDQVSRNLAAGRFLLLIVGDGIAEGTRRIGEFLVGQPGLSFDFALVEMAQYRWPDSASEQIIVQPRLLAKTAIIERAVIRNEAASVTIDDIPREPSLGPGQAAGPRLDPAFQQQWRDFAERFIANTRFDDPSQPPPRIGGLGWMRLPLPPPAAITLWRSRPQERAGAFVRLSGTEGLAAYEELAADRLSIDAEFQEAGLDPPLWDLGPTSASISLSWSAPYPWDEAAEDSQASQLARAANQLVNSLRPRLAQLSLSAASAS